MRVLVALPVQRGNLTPGRARVQRTVPSVSSDDELVGTGGGDVKAERRPRGVVVGAEPVASRRLYATNVPLPADDKSAPVAAA